MTLLLYFVFALVYILTIHFAIAIKDEFNLFLMGILFTFGAFIGYWFASYELGFVTAVILSLVFW